ncbi:hypothetical protein DYQ86_25400 [Acidobacteria bacterium AB60]|nr:hypothetical protein DYQ86_25400 [Acidobacteria bacterium AB60]
MRKAEAGRYAEAMLRSGIVSGVFAGVVLWGAASAQVSAQNNDGTWTFAVSGDSRNCGDFVMPAIAEKVKAEGDAFYWHLGDFRWMSQPDQDLLAMMPGGIPLSKHDYQERAWDDFLTHQMASFAKLNVPVFLGRGNHETVPNMTREGYIAKFSSFLDMPKIAEQRKAEGSDGAPLGPWYDWVERGVDFITMDNSTHDEFSEAQLHWLRAVLDRDLAPNSEVHTIVMGAHEALPHSTGSEHAMDDWEQGVRSGELVYTWFYDAQAAGKHVYLIASHSHYFSPDIYDTSYWKQRTKNVVPGLIVGTSGAHRYQLPKTAKKGAKTMVYGFAQGTVHPDGSIDFAFHELSEDDLMKAKWPNAPAEAVHECFVHNGDAGGDRKD